MNNLRDGSPNESHTLTLIINNQKFDWHHQYITGAELKRIANISKDEKLFLAMKKPWEDELILDDTKVNLARPGIEHFFSRISIIVNGREKNWDDDKISFNQVIKLSNENYVENPNTVYTVTYKRGPKQNPEGSMVMGDSVFVQNKMIFNVSATDKS